MPLWSTKRGRLIPSTDPDPDQDPRDPRARARERLILLVTPTRKERLNPRERPDQTDPDQDQGPDLVLATKRERLILLSTLRPNFMLRWLILSPMTRERPPPFYSELDVETDTELQSLALPLNLWSTKRERLIPRTERQDQDQEQHNDPDPDPVWGVGMDLEEFMVIEELPAAETDMELWCLPLF